MRAVLPSASCEWRRRTPRGSRRAGPRRQRPCRRSRPAPRPCVPSPARRRGRGGRCGRDRARHRAGLCASRATRAGGRRRNRPNMRVGPVGGRARCSSAAACRDWSTRTRCPRSPSNRCLGTARRRRPPARCRTRLPGQSGATATARRPFGPCSRVTRSTFAVRPPRSASSFERPT